MIVALVDNGSLAPAAHRHLRTMTRALGARGGVTVHAVSWKHSDRIPAADLGGAPAWTLTAFVRAMVALGQRDFVFVPFFISPQGAIGSALREDLLRLRREIEPFEFTFTDGLDAGQTLPAIAADLIRATAAARSLSAPRVVLVDHGGPSPASAQLRDHVARQTRDLLGADVASVAAASMEGIHPPLLADLWRTPEFAGGDVIIVPLFLSPGRHAGPGGDIDRLCRHSLARCHRTELAGSHPAVLDALARALLQSLSKVLAPSPA